MELSALDWYGEVENTENGKLHMGDCQQKRVAKIEAQYQKLMELLRNRANTGAPSALEQVELEALKSLSPADATLLRTARSAYRENRFHTLEEYAAVQKHRSDLLEAAKRLGFPSLGAAVRRTFIRNASSPGISSETSDQIVGILNWGRANASHVRALAQAHRQGNHPATRQQQEQR
jgi:hypothetical protein